MTEIYSEEKNLTLKGFKTKLQDEITYQFGDYPISYKKKANKIKKLQINLFKQIENFKKILCKSTVGNFIDFNNISHLQELLVSLKREQNNLEKIITNQFLGYEEGMRQILYIAKKYTTTKEWTLSEIIAILKDKLEIRCNREDEINGRN